MKLLLLVLMALSCRELVTPEWRQLATRPYRGWCELIQDMANTRIGNDFVLLAVTVLGPMLAVAAILLGLSEHGFWYLVLSALVVLPVFMDRELPSVLIACRQEWLNVMTVEFPEARLDRARRQLLLGHLRELFSPLLWFLMLGPVLLTGYYLLRLMARDARNADVRALAERCLLWLDWLPSRVLAVSFALAGEFREVWGYLQETFQERSANLEDFLVNAARRAEVIGPGEDLRNPLALLGQLGQYESLCTRSLVIWLVLLTLHFILPF